MALLVLLGAVWILGAMILSTHVFNSICKLRPEDGTWLVCAYCILVSLRWPWTLLKLCLGTERVVYIIAKEDKDALHKRRQEKEEPDQEGLG